MLACAWGSDTWTSPDCATASKVASRERCDSIIVSSRDSFCGAHAVQGQRAWSETHLQGARPCSGHPAGLRGARNKGRKLHASVRYISVLKIHNSTSPSS